MALTDDKIAKCPFFKSATVNTIECDSDFAFACVHKFKNRESKQKHRRKYCNTYNYKNCSLCRNILKTYDEDGKKIPYT